MGNVCASYPELTAVNRCETSRFMGTWFVIAVKPTYFETTCSNAVERYTLLSDSHHDIDIDFQYNLNDPITSPLKSLPQRGWVQGNKKDSSNWKVSPFGPIRLDYPIIELDQENYEYTVIGQQSRKYLWIMSRKPTMDPVLYQRLKKDLVEKHKYDLTGLREVPQYWTREEREKRNLVEDIADEYLSLEIDKFVM